METLHTPSETMGDAEEKFEILGASRAFRPRGSVSGSGVPLGLDRRSDETRGWARKGAVLVRAYRASVAGVGRRRSRGDARGRFPESGGVGARESEFVRSGGSANPLDCRRRADIRQARGATREPIGCFAARSATVWTRSRWRDLEIGGFSPGIAGSV